MTEHVARFGQWRSLTGVVTDPDGGEDDPDRPTLLLLNAGLLHHVGPTRLHVRLARRLAAYGFRSFRFDLSGVGDSALREDRMPRGESVVAETREAMDYLERHHDARRFVLFGICSGAAQACWTGLVDPRVVGTVQVDGYRYRTMGFYFHHYGRRLFRPGNWKSVLTGQNPLVASLVARLKGSRTESNGTDPTTPPSPPLSFPSRQETEARLLDLVERNGNLLVIYTQDPLFNHPGQFRGMFPTLARDARVSMRFLDQADHLFTLRAFQESLIGVVESWMRETKWS